MKFKTSAIALAVAGAVAIPMAAQADIYANVRVGVDSTDYEGVNDIEVTSKASRVGFKSETDLGNGLTGFGKFEWDVDMEGGSSIGLRHRYVGLKGDMGSLTMGQTYHSYYNNVYGPTDNPWWGSGYAYFGPGRTSDGITFAGSAGAVAFGVTTYFTSEADEDKPDGYEAALSMGVGDMTLGVGIRSAEADSAGTDYIDESEGVTGIVLSGIGIGDGSLGVGYQMAELGGEDVDMMVIDAGIGNAYVHYETYSIDDVDLSSITLGYTQSIGRNTTAYYELVSFDSDDINYSDPFGTDSTDVNDDDQQTLRAILKYNIE